MSKFLILLCLISTALFCFTSASPTTYEYNSALAQGNQHRKLSNAYQKRDTGAGQKNMDDQVAKRAFTDSRALNIAQAVAGEPDATKDNVLQALFEFLIGHPDLIAARAANMISEIPKEEFVYWHSEVQNIFEDNPMNVDTEGFFNYLFSEPRNYRKAVIGIVLALVPQEGNRLLGHRDMSYLLDDTSFIDESVLKIGQELLGMGEAFTYNGELPRSLVIEVIVAAVAVSTGEAQTPQDIPRLMSSLSPPQ